MRRLSPRGWVVMVLAVVLLIGAGAWWQRRQGASVASFRTAPVTRGELTVTINATGTVEPEEVINVGAQVAGQILAFGHDIDGRPVDYGSVVEADTGLARIDDSLYQAETAQSEAQLESARANVRRARAELEQARAKRALAERDWRRAQQIGPGDALARSSYDSYQSAFETTQAGVAVAEAAVLQSEAAVRQAEAGLSRARRNLGYCTIKAPVRGVIIDRRVNIGQTVVASLNAPSLFLIAKDLRRIQVWVAVNEADIGRIRVGLPVRFTVDAFPGETFRGEVGKVRLNAAMTQNVVTYTVEIVTDNESGRLLPYLTASVEFELERVAESLLAPNAALRWQPTADQVAPAWREEFDKIQARRGRGGSRGAGGEDRKKDAGEQGVVWLLEEGKVRPLALRLGQSDGSMTVAAGDGLSEGLPLVTGLNVGTNRAGGTENPFSPKFPGRGSQGKGQR